MNDNDDVLRLARRALPEGHMGIPVEKIMAMGRSRRHRRFGTLSVTGTAAAAAAALGVTGVLGTGGHAASVAGGRAAPVAVGTIRTTGFTLASNANGTDTLTLTRGQAFNPGALQQALRQVGIPALVTSGQLCRSDPQPQPPLSGIFSLQLPGGRPVRLMSWNVLRVGPAGFGYRIPGDAVLVINPAVLPAGTELWFGYKPDAQELLEGVVDPSSHTCRPFLNKQLPKAGSTGSAGNS